MSATTNNKMAGSHVVKTEGDHGQNVVGAQVGRDVIHHVVNNNNYYVAADPNHAVGAPVTDQWHRGPPSRGLESQSKPLVVFAGSHGVGKSTFANSFIGEHVFKTSDL